MWYSVYPVKTSIQQILNGYIINQLITTYWQRSCLIKVLLKTMLFIISCIAFNKFALPFQMRNLLIYLFTKEKTSTHPVASISPQYFLAPQFSQKIINMLKLDQIWQFQHKNSKIAIFSCAVFPFLPPLKFSLTSPLPPPPPKFWCWCCHCTHPR